MEENCIRLTIDIPISKTPLPEVILQITSFKYYLKSKRYSENTIKTFTDSLKSFLIFFEPKPANEITNDDVIKYNSEFILANTFSASYQNQIVNAIKLYYSSIQNKAMIVDKIHRPRAKYRLPNVLSKEKVKAIVEA